MIPKTAKNHPHPRKHAAQQGFRRAVRVPQSPPRAELFGMTTVFQYSCWIIITHKVTDPGLRPARTVPKSGVPLSHRNRGTQGQSPAAHSVHPADLRVTQLHTFPTAKRRGANTLSRLAQDSRSHEQFLNRALRNANAFVLFLQSMQKTYHLINHSFEQSALLWNFEVTS